MQYIYIRKIKSILSALLGMMLFASLVLTVCFPFGIAYADDPIPNLKYEYAENDILLIIDRQIRNRNFLFRELNQISLVDSLFSDNESLSIIDRYLPSYIINGDGDKLEYQDHTLILAGDLQSTIKFTDWPLRKIHDSLIEGGDKYVIVFPLHIGGSIDGQSGHWNLAALYIDFERRIISFENYEPLRSGDDLEEDRYITESSFYEKLKQLFDGFNVRQRTIATGQQNDSHLCGVIAAENFTMFLGDDGALKRK